MIKAKDNNIVDTSHLYDVLLARKRIFINEIQNAMLVHLLKPL